MQEILAAYMDLGICPSMLMPGSFTDSKEHLRALRMGCRLEQYRALDLYLTDNDEIAREEIRILREQDKIINYNSPAQFQNFGAYNAGSELACERQGALDFAKKHLDYAAEIGADLFVVTSCPDVPERRQQIHERFSSFMQSVCQYARERHIHVVIEPIERHRFKKLFLGPTEEVAAFIRQLRLQGCDNLSIMVDFGHLPLMEEDLDAVIAASCSVGMRHVHFGDAILCPSHPLYGHMHPPMCGRQGSYAMEDIARQFSALLACGYLGGPRKEKPRVSLEVRPYEGVSAQVSTLVHYKRMESALMSALERLG